MSFKRIKAATYFRSLEFSENLGGGVSAVWTKEDLPVAAASDASACRLVCLTA